MTGVPAQVIREFAHAYARADRAILCWTLGITEHVTAVDNVLSLINLALLTGHVGRYGSGLNPLRGQNNVQGGGDMGAIPNKLPGFQDVQDDMEARARFEAAWDAKLPPERGWHLSQMFDGMERGELNTLYVLGENPAQSEADSKRALGLLEGLDFMIAQDILMTKTCEMADVVLPSSASWCESEGGTVTNSERRVQLMRKAIDPPGEARDDQWIICELAKRLGHDWGQPTPEQVWDELRSLSPMHGGMSYKRLEEEGGIQWPCPTEDHPGSEFLHGRLWAEPVEGPLAPFSVTPWAPPIDELDDDFPIRLTTGRRLDSYNTGVQSGLYSSPLRRGETLDLSPEGRRDARRRARRDRADHVAPRLDPGARAARSGPASRARVHDHALPRRRRRQHPHDRRDRPEVGDRGVQGDGRPGGEGPRASNCRCDQHRGRQVAWTYGCWTPSRRRRSATPSTPSWARRWRSGPAPTRSTTGTPRTAATRRARSATCCCRRCTRCTSARAGSAPAA